MSLQNLPGLLNPTLINQTLSKRSLRLYMEQVVINCRPRPKRFIEVGEEWQWKNLNMIIPAVESVAGINPKYSGPTGLWFGMVRGSDKTSSIARTCNWCLAFSPTYLKISVGAADVEQAKLVRNAMLDEARLNPWFGDSIKISQYQASGPGGELEIMPADAKGAYGLTSDIYICDELTHWKDEDFWISLYSARLKRSGCLYFCTRRVTPDTKTRGRGGCSFSCNPDPDMVHT